MNLIHRVSAKAVKIILPFPAGWMSVIKLDQVKPMKADGVNHIPLNPGFFALKPANHRQRF